jgi:hypothetical protein
MFMGCDLANVFAKIKHEMARMTAEAVIDLFSFVTVGSQPHMIIHRKIK